MCIRDSPKLWYVPPKTYIFLSKTVVCCHPKLWYVFPPQTGDFKHAPSCIVFPPSPPPQVVCSTPFQVVLCSHPKLVSKLVCSHPKVVSSSMPQAVLIIMIIIKRISRAPIYHTSWQRFVVFPPQVVVYSIPSYALFTLQTGMFLLQGVVYSHPKMWHF